MVPYQYLQDTRARSYVHVLSLVPDKLLLQYCTVLRCTRVLIIRITSTSTKFSHTVLHRTYQYPYRCRFFWFSFSSVLVQFQFLFRSFSSDFVQFTIFWGICNYLFVVISCQTKSQTVEVYENFYIRVRIRIARRKKIHTHLHLQESQLRNF